MRRRVTRLEQAATSNQSELPTITFAIPPDDPPAEKYDAWAAAIDEARREGRRLITLNIGDIHGTTVDRVQGEADL